MNPVWNRVVEMANHQDWPAGALYVIATPIGNMADITLRATVALQKADALAVEDTRKAKVLCDLWGVSLPMIVLHKHNERKMTDAVLGRLAEGQRVALISDAGTPCVSDPGALLVHAVREKGYRVIPLPGPCAATAAYMTLGSKESADPGFIFLGFPPAAEQARKEWFMQYANSKLPIIFYMAPHDVARYLLELSVLLPVDRRITLARELTKRYETIATFSLTETASWLQEQERQDSLRGEFVVILEPATELAAKDHFTPAFEKTVQQLVQAFSVKDTVEILAELTSHRPKVLYDLALKVKKQNS